jgi:hypothetical protein
MKDLKIEIDITKILNAVSSKKEFEIDIDGNVYINEKCDQRMPLFFQLNSFENVSSLLDANALIKNIFKDYKPTINGTLCNLKPLMNWQEVISLNQENMLYFDHHNDGIELFENKELEDIGWNSVPFDIKYREIAEFIETNCEGTFVFYDNDIQFNGFVIVNDIEKVITGVKEFVIKTINEKIKNDLVDLEDEDVIESLEYFEIEV